MKNMTPNIIPMVAYEEGTIAMDWLCKVFGFTESVRMTDENGKLAHGEITLGNGIVMLASPTPDYLNPKHHREVCKTAAEIYKIPYIIDGILVYVDDVKHHFDRSKANGAMILSELEDGGPGLRYRVEDLEGHRWMFMQR